MNLKQAARALGVHYQTAYKLVRSGRLSAVCVGARYEISPEAIERYQAERQAMRRVPAVAARSTTSSTANSTGRAAAEAALDAPAVSADTVIELVTDSLCAELGDLAVVRELSRDGAWFLPGVVRHQDPARRATIAATIGSDALEVDPSRVLRTVAEGEPVLKAIMPQDCVRVRLDPDALQHFDVAGIHSLIAVPARIGEVVVGLVAVTRDAPGRPYTREDMTTVEQHAAIVGAGIARARLTSESWVRRRSLVASVANLLDGENPGPHVESLLGEDDRLAEVVCDPKGRIVAANGSAGRLLGAPIDEIVGRSLTHFVSKSIRTAHDERLQQLMRGEITALDTTAPLISADGDGTEPTAIRFGAVRDAHAHLRALVAVAHALPTPACRAS